LKRLDRPCPFSPPPQQRSNFFVSPAAAAAAAAKHCVLFIFALKLFPKLVGHDSSRRGKKKVTSQQHPFHNKTVPRSFAAACVRAYVHQWQAH
jgi:hypothetical protein